MVGPERVLVIVKGRGEDRLSIAQSVRTGERR